MNCKIDNYKVGTSFKIECTKQFRDGEFRNYDSFGIVKNFANMWARKPEDVITVKCTIIEEDVVLGDLYKTGYDSKQCDYFGWIDFEDDGTYSIHMIYPNALQYSICFPYGPDAQRFYIHDINEGYKVIHKKGDRRGMTVRLKVEEI